MIYKIPVPLNILFLNTCPFKYIISKIPVPLCTYMISKIPVPLNILFLYYLSL